MEDLKGCVQQVDSKKLPQFLDQVSNGSMDNDTSRHFAISLYAELAQVHKQEVIPFIPRIMASIVRSLPFSSDPQQLHEACAKVVTSLARYTIDPTRPHEYNQQIISGLCSPLLPVLDSKLEPSALGAAICLQALVESEKWKFAPFDLQNLVCAKATTALVQGGVPSVALLRLTRSLAKFSKKASRGQVEQWLRISLQILQARSGDPGLWQQHVAASQLIVSLVRTADVRKLDLDLCKIAQILEACQMDKVFLLRNAVQYALEAVKSVKLQHSEVNSDCSEHDEAGSLELGSQTRNKSFETEESGLHEMSDSISPRSGNSSHDGVLSTTSSTGKCAVGPEFSLLLPVSQGTKKPSHARTGFECKDNDPKKTTVRRVLSEIPTSDKLLRNLEGLPTSKPSRMSSLEPRKKTERLQVGSLPAENGRLHSFEQAQDVTMRYSIAKKQHGESCQSVSHVGCMCSICLRVADQWTAKGCHDNHATSSGQSSSSIEDAVITENQGDEIHKCRKTLLLSLIFKSGTTIDDDDSLLNLTGGGELSSNGGTEVLRTKEASDISTSECSTASIKEGDVKVAKKSPVGSKDFSFRKPQNLMASLYSSSKRGGVHVQNCKEGTLRVRMRRTRSVGTLEEDNQITSNDRLCKHETPCCASCDMNQSIGRGINEECMKAQRNRDEDHKVTVSHSEVEASGQSLLSISGGSNATVDKKTGNGEHHPFRIMKEKGPDSLVGMEDQPTLPSAGLGLEYEDVQYCGGKTWLGLMCAVGMVVLACIVMRHADQSHDLHALVPT